MSAMSALPFKQPAPLVPCKECGKPIRRVFAGSIDGWGHLVNPAANHHYARPASRSAVDRTAPRPATSGTPDARLRTQRPSTTPDTNLAPDGGPRRRRRTT